eukprot:173755_1
MNQFINLLTSSIAIFPGESIPIIINKNQSLVWVNNMYQFTMYTQQNAFKINDILQIKVRNQTIKQCKICKDSQNKQCIDCKKGVIPTIDSRFINETYTAFNIYFESINNNISIYPANGLSIKLKICPPGYGINSDSCANCLQCSYNKFMLTASIKPCYSCKQEETHYLNGVKCEGGDNIIVSYNYWVAAVSNTSQLHPLIEYTKGDIIYSVYCPSGFCCTTMNGCNYIDSYNEYKNNFHSDQRLCAFGRDPKSNLCGVCEQGKSSLFGTTNCGICDETNYTLIFFIICLIYVPFTIYIVYFESAPQQTANNNNKIIQNLQIINSLFFDVFFYFYQAVSVILAAKGYSVSSWTVSLFSIINLQPSNMSSSDKESGFCLFANIDSYQKLLFNFIYPSFFIPILILIAPFKSLKYLLCCCCVKDRNLVAKPPSKMLCLRG